MAQGYQLGIGSSSVMSDHGHSMAGDGGTLDPETALAPQPKVDFGDGSDGDLITAANITLTRDMSYNNLTLSAGFWYRNAGFKIKVKGKLTLAVGSTVWADGGVGGNGAAGVGGVGGAVEIVGRKPYACLPTPGAAGGNAGAAGVDDWGNKGIAPVVHMAHLTVDVSLLNEGRLWAGAGGGGGGAVSFAPDNGGTPLAVLAGAKGGDGGDGRLVGGANHQFAGGGGGGGGGLLEIWANEIDNNTVINASGGAGGAGQGDANAQAGGGGGGGGGAILIFYKTLSGGGLGVRNVAGGVAGGSFGGLANGQPGAAGYSYAMKIGA